MCEFSIQLLRSVARALYKCAVDAGKTTAIDQCADTVCHGAEVLTGAHTNAHVRSSSYGSDSGPPGASQQPSTMLDMKSRLASYGKGGLLAGFSAASGRRDSLLARPSLAPGPAVAAYRGGGEYGGFGAHYGGVQPHMQQYIDQQQVRDSYSIQSHLRLR